MDGYKEIAGFVIRQHYLSFAKNGVEFGLGWEGMLMLKPTASDGLSRGSHFTRLKVPAAKRYWPRPAIGPAFDVVGVAQRRDAALRFARATIKCEKTNQSYGVVGVRELGNPHDSNAIMVMGQWVERGWFGGERASRAHVGYVPADVAAELVKAYGTDRNPDLSLYSVYLSDDGYVDITVIAIRPGSRLPATEIL